MNDMRESLKEKLERVASGGSDLEGGYAKRWKGGWECGSVTHLWMIRKSSTSQRQLCLVLSYPENSYVPILFLIPGDDKNFPRPSPVNACTDFYFLWGPHCNKTETHTFSARWPLSSSG